MLIFHQNMVSQRRARLRVSLQNSQVKTVQRIETVTIIDFLATSGGILGLFMGFSVLSIIEFIYYPTLRLFRMIWRMKTDKDEDEKKTPAQRPVSDKNAAIQTTPCKFSFICRRNGHDCEDISWSIVRTAIFMAFDISLYRI